MSKKKEKQNTTHDRNSALTTYIRIGIIALAILLQLGIMMFTTYFLRANAAPLYVALDILAMVTVFSLINRHDSSAYRLAWIVVVLMTPIVGMALYWLWGRVDFNKKEKGALNTAFENGFMKLPANKPQLNQFTARYDLHDTVGSGLHDLVVSGCKEQNTRELDQTIVQSSNGFHV